MNLTKRQSQCVHLLCSGLTPKQIGHELGLKQRCVNRHIQKARTELNVKTIPQLGYVIGVRNAKAVNV